jgi:hypothetical protein
VDAECPGGTFCSPLIDACTVVELIPPGPVTDLRVDLLATTESSLRLVFTAPGDDGFVPATRALSYRVRIAPLVDGVLGAATFVAIADQPLPAFTPSHVIVDALEAGALYQLALEVTDDAGNASLSNVIVAQTGGGACPPDRDGGERTAIGSFEVTTAEHLVSLLGCTAIEGSLHVDDSECDVGSLAQLAALTTISGAVSMSLNVLCPDADPGGGDHDLVGLAQAGSVIVRDAGGGTALTFPALTTVGRIRIEDNGGDVELSLPLLTSVDDPPDDDFSDVLVYGNEGRVALHLPLVTALDDIALGTVADGFAGNSGDVLLDLPALTTVGVLEARDNTGDLRVDADALSAGDIEIANAPGLTRLDLPALADGNVLLDSIGATEVLLPSLADATIGVYTATALTRLSLPGLQHGALTILSTPTLVELELDAMIDGDVALGDVDALVDFTLPSFESGNVYVQGVDALETLALPSADLDTLTLVVQDAPLATLSLPPITSVYALVLIAPAPLPDLDDLAVVHRQLELVGFSFTSLTLPSLVRVGLPGGGCVDQGTERLGVVSMPNLVDLHLPLLQHVHHLFLIQDPALDVLDVPSLTSCMWYANASATLTQAELDAITAQCANPC